MRRPAETSARHDRLALSVGMLVLLAGLLSERTWAAGPLFVNDAGAPLSTRDHCTTFQGLVVPVGTRVFRTRATTPTRRTDVDQLRLRCAR